MKSFRDKSMIADAAFGATLQSLADKHGISAQRVDQIVGGNLRQLGFSLPRARLQPHLVMSRLRASEDPALFCGQAETPQAFFFELQHEPRRFA